MRAINYIFKVIIIFITLLIIIASGILYVRPDIKPQDFLQNWQFWIIPIALLYIIINFKTILTKTVNKFLIAGILIWAGYFFYPNIMNQIKPYALNYFGNSTEKVKTTINDLATPKDGSKPVFQIKNNNEQSQKQNNNKQEPQQEKKLDLSNKESITKNLPQLSNEQIKELAQQPIEYLSSIADMAPPEVKQKLEKIGIDLKNPTQSISDLVGKDPNKQRKVINTFFK